MLAGQVLILTLWVSFHQLDLISSQQPQTGCSKYYKLKLTTPSSNDPTGLPLNPSKNNTSKDDLRVSFSSSSSSSFSSSSSETFTIDEALSGQKSGSISQPVHSKRHNKRDVVDLNQTEDLVQDHEPELRTINEEDDQYNVLSAKTGFSKFSKHPKSKHTTSKEDSKNETDSIPKSDTKLSDAIATSLIPTGEIPETPISSVSGDTNTTDSYTSPSTSTSKGDGDNEIDQTKKDSSPPKFSPPTSKSQGLHGKGIKKDVQAKPSLEKLEEKESKKPTRTVKNGVGSDQVKSDLTATNSGLQSSLQQPNQTQSIISSDLNLNSKTKIGADPTKIIKSQSGQGSSPSFKTSGNVEMIPSGKGICGPVLTDSVLGVCLWSGSDQTGNDVNQSGWLTTALNSNCGKEVILSRSDNPSLTITAKVVDGCGFNQLKADVGCSEIYLTKMAFLALKPNEIESKSGHLNNLVWKFKDSTQIN
ncbi:uncharacterized protein MELLADRAFT_77357 [Melampsora larici-populina 98AG31]|uniref:Secreted protein n=1 Tax=Melampsora larici-populina (strain 98AG31 / pathotype 3-4-7) TaxID=747676 RepID=F4RG70_MELLP|nr:uncharacterized protein MELLADRAFT_77357 [Melampsora larici-populina 98AG31]EGG08557.1 hypothetical protein MELLADRAFT_77357 [Melampsora larici-populina 98AG31]